MLTVLGFYFGARIAVAVADSHGGDHSLPAANEHVPGWIAERVYFADPIKCPWLDESDAPDADCFRRLQELKQMQDAIGTCESPFRRSNRVIGHRGAPLVAPEETEASWAVGAESGAGYLECDVSVTSDLDFVCRHGTCDLHTTTDLIANHPNLNAKCTRPFVPGSGVAPICCTYDFTVAELEQLCAVMDAEHGNASAITRQGYWTGPPGFRSGAIAKSKCHPMVKYSEYLQLMKRSGYNVIPELKGTMMPGIEHFLAKQGLTWRFLAGKMADMLGENGFPSVSDDSHAIMQTFDHRVAEYWKTTRPSIPVEYMWETTPPPGRNCSATGIADCGSRAILEHLNSLGVEMFSPPIQRLVDSAPGHRIVKSATAKMLHEIGVRAIGTWSLERQGCDLDSPEKQPSGWAPCGIAGKGFYYSTLEGQSAFQHADVFRVLDVLFREVKIVGLFSDFPATVATYINCILGADQADRTSLLAGTSKPTTLMV